MLDTAAMQVADDPQTGGAESFAAFWIQRASSLIVRRTDARLRPFGLSMSYLPILRTLARGASPSPSEHARRSRTRFAKALAALRDGEREAMAGLSDEEQELLRELLKRVVRNLEDSLQSAASLEWPG